MTTRRWLILGAGYAGARFAKRLAADGLEVWATVRDIADAEALEASGVAAVVADFGQPVAQRLLKVAPTTAVLSIPPPRNEGEGVPEPEALRWAKAQGADRVIYWSSTSVYGFSEGGVVDESTPIAPQTAVGARRAAAEARVRETAEALGLALAIVRIVGIYGPGRNMRQRIARGDYVMADGGELWSNRVHVDDIGTATRCIDAAESMEGVWLLSDGASFRVRELVAWVSEALGVEMPGSVPLAEMEPRRQAFWTGDRRVQPARLIAAGWVPRYPGYQAGLRASWAEEAGEAR